MRSFTEMEKQTIAIVAVDVYLASFGRGKKRRTVQEAIGIAAKIVDEVAVHTATPQKVDA